MKKFLMLTLALCLLLLCLHLCFIWGNSLMPAEVSASFSEQVMDTCIQPILSFLGETPSADGISDGDRMHLLRKAAHFTEYWILGMNLCWLFQILKEKGIHSFTMPLLLGILTAILDESIQLYSPGRSGQITDVWIDTAGLTLGIILVLTGYSIWTKGKQNTFGG